MRLLDIGQRRVGPGHPCFLIAEAGVNHNGDINLALELIDAAAAAGADAVKFQTFTANRLVTRTAPKAAYQVQQTGPRETQFEMLRRLELSPEAHQRLATRCLQCEVEFMSTPFDEESADLLAELGVRVFKIPSGEITNLPYLAHIAGKQKPMIVSTGMSGLGEIEDAVRTIRRNRDPALALLHCVSNYPANPADCNLRALQTLQVAFGVPTGYSDHSPGIEVALASVALGACILEKHFTLDRTLPGPDHQSSLEPGELASLVRGVRIVESALGHGRKEPTPRESDTAAVARKSLVVARDLAAGDILTPEMIAIKRPGTGLPPAMRDTLVGRRLKTSAVEGSLFTLEMLG